MPAKLDLRGERFGKLVVLDEADRRGKAVVWRCQCDCGGEVLVRANNLRSGNTRSCGCEGRNYRHGYGRAGANRAAEYRIWNAMLQRCSNPRHRAYRHYGARGITVCERWRSFESFLADMGRRPSAAYSIDRIDNDGPYAPSNCRWATRSQQGLNRGGYRHSAATRRRIGTALATAHRDRPWQVPRGPAGRFTSQS